MELISSKIISNCMDGVSILEINYAISIKRLFIRGLKFTSKSNFRRTIEKSKPFPNTFRDELEVGPVSEQE